MVLRTLPLTPSSHSNFLPNISRIAEISCNPVYKNKQVSKFRVSAKEEEPKKSKQSLFGSITEALDFSQVRSEKDAELLEDAREATTSGERMSREQVHIRPSIT